MVTGSGLDEFRCLNGDLGFAAKYDLSNLVLPCIQDLLSCFLDGCQNLCSLRTQSLSLPMKFSDVST